LEEIIPGIVPETITIKEEKYNSYLIPALVGIAMLFMWMLSGQREAIQTDWKTVRYDYLQNNEVEKLIIVNKMEVEVYIKEEFLDQPKHKNVVRPRY
jgi:hypothetical protein